MEDNIIKNMICILKPIGFFLSLDITIIPKYFHKFELHNNNNQYSLKLSNYMYV